MSDSLDSNGPSQPAQQTGLEQPQNPADKTSSEQSKAQDPSTMTSEIVDKRVPSQHNEEATETSMGYGDRGPLKERDISESNKQNYANTELDGEQMRAPGEGEVAEAVQQKQGGGHKEEESLIAGLDDKAREHAAALHDRGERTGQEIEDEEGEDWTGKRVDVNVGEALGGEGRGTKIVLAADE